MVDGDLADNDVSRIGRKVRPRGVAIVAILQIIVGFLAIAFDVYSINTFSTHFVPGGGAGMVQLFVTYGLVIAGVFSWLLGWAIWKGWHWIWLTAVILDILGIMYSISILIGVVSQISQTGVLSLNNYSFSLSVAIPVLVTCSMELWYFSRGPTRRYFL